MQFKLKTILIGVGVVALLSAVIAPWVRQMPLEQQQWVGLQLIATFSGLGLGLGSGLLLHQITSRRLGRLLISLRQSSRSWTHVVFHVLLSCLFGFATLFMIVAFSNISSLGIPRFWIVVLFNEFGMSAWWGLSMLKLFERPMVMQIHERGIAVNRMPYLWITLRYVCWNAVSGNLSIAIGPKRIRASVPLDERAGVNAMFERISASGVLTIVDPLSDQGRTLTNLRGS
jgi:hypothetical protein